MNKKIYSFLVVIFLMFTLIFSSKIYGKDLVFESDISLDSNTYEKALTFRKYVRRYGTAENSEWKYGGTLGAGTNTAGSYVTIALSFHTKYGTNYTTDYNDSGVVRMAYDTNGKNISTISELNSNETNVFFNTYKISGNNFTGVKLRADSNTYNMGEIYTAQSVKLTRERTLDKMAITDFTIDGDSYVNLTQGIKEEILNGNVKEYNNNYYKILVSGQLDAYALDANGNPSTHFTKKDNIKTAQQLVDIMFNGATNAYYNNKINSVWTNNDFGFKEGYGTKGSSTVETGMSVLNNFDNTLLIPKSNLLETRDVYVNYQILGDDSGDGTFWNLVNTQRTQKLEDGTTLYSQGSTEFEGKNWIEHYVLNENQKNMIVKYADNTQLENAGYEPSNYEYAGVYVTSGTWKSSNSDLSELNPNETSYAVANEDSKTAIKVTFYYKVKNPDEKKQYVYIKHITEDGTIINGLKESETFSEGFRENDLTKVTSARTYQTAYKFKADGITHGGIYTKNKMNKRR